MKYVERSITPYDATLKLYPLAGGKTIDRAKRLWTRVYIFAYINPDPDGKFTTSWSADVQWDARPQTMTRQEAGLFALALHAAIVSAAAIERKLLQAVVEGGGKKLKKLQVLDMIKFEALEREGKLALNWERR